MKIQEVKAERLIKKGWVEVIPSPSKRYRVFRHPQIDCYWYLGKCGASRFGKCISKSYPKGI